MNPIDPAEISALLDGELPPERAEQVRRAIAEDEALRREYEELAALDAKMKACAEAAVFQPRVSLDAAPPARFPVIAVVIACLLLRLAAKTAPAVVGTGLEIGALLFVLVWVLRRALEGSQQEARRLLRLEPEGGIQP